MPYHEISDVQPHVAEQEDVCISAALYSQYCVTDIGIFVFIDLHCL